MSEEDRADQIEKELTERFTANFGWGDVYTPTESLIRAIADWLAQQEQPKE